MDLTLRGLVTALSANRWVTGAMWVNDFVVREPKDDARGNRSIQNYVLSHHPRGDLVGAEHPLSAFKPTDIHYLKPTTLSRQP